MPRRPITEQRKEAIHAALGRDSHASRVAQDLGECYATVWRIADQAKIELTAGRAARGTKPGQAERQAKVEEAARAHPGATQAQLARQTGLSRKTVRRVVGARRPAPSPTG